MAKAYITYRFFDSPGHVFQEYSKLYGEISQANAAMDNMAAWLKAHGHPVVYQGCWFTSDHVHQNCKLYAQPMPPPPKPNPPAPPPSPRLPRRAPLPFHWPQATRRGGRATSSYVPPVVAGPFDDIGQHVVERQRAWQPELPRSRFPFSIAGLGEPPSLTPKYKAILAAWGKAPGVSSPVPNFGTSMSDLAPGWNCLREGRMLAGFSKWWNSHGNNLSEGYYPKSGTCSGILVADLDQEHMAALDAYAIGATNIPNPGNAWPTSTPSPTPTVPTVDCAGKCAEKFGAGGQTPDPLGYIACMAACTGVNPTAPSPTPTLPTPPMPAPVPSPVPPQVPGVTDCDGKNPCPAGQICVNGKCQPGLPPPPSSPPAETKSSNVGLWVLGGLGVLGTVALIAAGARRDED